MLIYFFTIVLILYNYTYIHKKEPLKFSFKKLVVFLKYSQESRAVVSMLEEYYVTGIHNLSNISDSNVSAIQIFLVEISPKIQSCCAPPQKE